MHQGPWYVLHVEANHEKTVAQHLAIRPCEHYLPLYSQRSRWTDRYVNLERPLFTGYVFVRFAPEVRSSVVTTPGVLRLLGTDERDTVSAAEIDRIRIGLASNCRLLPHPYVTVGTPVRARSGIFEGAQGIVTELRRQCRVIIAVTAVRQCFSLEMELADLEVVRKPLTGELSRGKQQLAFAGARPI